VARAKEILEETHGVSIAYSTLTRLVRDTGIREPASKRSGSYEFGLGVEMQHDTSPHRVMLSGKPMTAHCAGLVLAYSRRAFIQYYPAFTRFEAKVFLTEAMRFMDGGCRRCIVDNTSVIVAKGSGADAEMAPEMESFLNHFGAVFQAHRIGHADRKAYVERLFSYVETNFLAGRTFADWRDLNRQAYDWCGRINAKPKRSLGMSADEAYVMEKPHMTPLPPHIYETRQILHRVVDIYGYVSVDTNRYSVPDRLIGKQVEAHKHWEHVRVFFRHDKVADHPRQIGKHNSRITDPRHHRPLVRAVKKGPCREETSLLGHTTVLDQYVAELKTRSNGRGIRPLRRLLEMKRTYPADAFVKAVERAFEYGLYDLARLEQMVLSNVGGDFFNIGGGDDAQEDSPTP